MSYLTSEIDENIVRLLCRGGVGLLPSDTIYGLSCLALDRAAVAKLHTIKLRDAAKPFIILISTLKMLDLLSIENVNRQSLALHWPGFITIILDAPNSPRWLTLGLNTLAIRMPNNEKLLSLIDKCGPLISTSANLKNQPTVTNAVDAQNIFGEKLDFYVDSGVKDNKLPSTIVRLVGDKFEIIRQGAFKIK